MNDLRLDDEMLMAYADGELDEAAMARVEEAMVSDPTVAERVALFMESRASVAAALKPLADEPVPDALLAAVRDMAARGKTARQEAVPDDNVVAFPDRSRSLAAAPSHRWAMGLAASFALLLAGTGGYLIGGLARTPGLPGELAVLGDPNLAAALDTLPSGSDVALSGDAGRARLVSSFRDRSGTLCREFELNRTSGDNAVSIVCRTGGAWRTHLMVSLPGSDGGYAPASSVAAVDAWVEATEAGSTLSGEDERAALEALR